MGGEAEGADMGLMVGYSWVGDRRDRSDQIWFGWRGTRGGAERSVKSLMVSRSKIRGGSATRGTVYVVYNQVEKGRDLI